jgi:hypothetical protein
MSALHTWFDRVESTAQRWRRVQRLEPWLLTGKLMHSATELRDIGFGNWAYMLKPERTWQRISGMALSDLRRAGPEGVS